MRWLLELLGALLDAVIGPSVTRMEEAGTKNAKFEMRPTVNDPEMEIGIRSHQRIYRTTFTRWGLSITRSVFSVQGFAPDEIKDHFDPRLFECVCYPTLCLKMLKWTEYPHVYAIRAYIERVLPDSNHLPYKVQL